MKKYNMNLTEKQYNTLKGLLEIEQCKKGKKVPVSDIYCELTAVRKIIAPNWFDRTFKVLEEKGLIEKENMEYAVPGGFKKGEIVKTYTYCLTLEGVEYFGLSIDDIEITIDNIEKIEENILTDLEEKQVDSNLSYKDKCKLVFGYHIVDIMDLLPRNWNIEKFDNKWIIRDDFCSITNDISKEIKHHLKRVNELYKYINTEKKNKEVK